MLKKSHLVFLASEGKSDHPVFKDYLDDSTDEKIENHRSRRDASRGSSRRASPYSRRKEPLTRSLRPVSRKPLQKSTKYSYSNDRPTASRYHNKNDLQLNVVVAVDSNITGMGLSDSTRKKISCTYIMIRCKKSTIFKKKRKTKINPAKLCTTIFQMSKILWTAI